MNARDVLALSMAKGIGSAFIKRNLDRIIKDSTCLHLLEEVKPDQLGFVQSFFSEADKIISDCDKYNIEIISISSDNYPRLLLELNDPPCVLFAKGNLQLLQNCIAIIGTRKSTLLGDKIAERLGAYFSSNYSVCNGLVEGIDEHSIYVDGKVLPNVVGIISGGLCYDKTCSKKHVKVIDEVLSSNGLIISEYPPMQKEDAYSGSKASRIQAGLSKGLILVQSSKDGGSKYTIAAFSKLGRPIGVIHYPSSDEYKAEVFSGNRLLVEKKIQGIAEMIGIKSTSKFGNIPIVVIEGKSDYPIFEDYLTNKSCSMNLF